MTRVLVLGSGIAGCSAALAAAETGADVVLATKATRPEETTTHWAQGGVAVSRDDPEAFAADVVEAGDGRCDAHAVDVLVRNADDAVREVLVETLDVPFADDYGREAPTPRRASGTSARRPASTSSRRSSRTSTTTRT
ncbi:L-aspartate oxidase [Halarchaeum acidiphilum MH1-52-1]|uniref:L-aspartate oxidase n=1 Tax=Halarchaeum acidiphilum MH1-52-1 TaxID=1261545 RepID=U2YT56_9EURY|nr:FAD-dependent oxidoreductase [Halarchaeum acidiphilum]GAD52195.1 L-aspartate oxidase [Halarchaeum acidiphilum MH1-52-1]